MAPSTHDDHHHMSTSAPPPTPTTTHPHPSSSSATPSLLSNFLIRLPPTLSLPTRCRTTATPLTSLSSQMLRDGAKGLADQFGFFQLTDHSVPPQLANTAASEALLLYSTNQPYDYPEFPLGYDEDHDSFCFASERFTESTRSLGELTREMERVGMEVIDAVGFGNQVGEGRNRIRSLTWVSKVGQDDGLDGLGRVYPYVIGLQYQVRCRKVSLLADSGWVSVSPEINSILVTFGDIAQVWSNGKIKKVRGMPVPIVSTEPPNKGNESAINCISMTTLLTLPLGSTVSPQLGRTLKSNERGEKDHESGEDTLVFDSFSFEDYAWRVYHDRLHLKDPLDRYRLV